MTRKEAINSFYCIEAGSDGVELVNEIYDDFESRTCQNCKHYYQPYTYEYSFSDPYACRELSSRTQITPYSKLEENIFYPDKDFGCNKWEQK